MIGDLNTRAYILLRSMSNTLNCRLSRFVKVSGMLLCLMSVLYSPKAYAQSYMPLEPVSISFENETLVDAFRRLEHAAGVSIAFSDPSLYTTETTTAFESTAVGDILIALLRNKRMKVHEVASRQFVIVSLESNIEQAPALDMVLGRVQDAESGNALAGATIYLKQKRFGMISDHEGNFALNADWIEALDRDTLVVQYVGYEPTQIPGVKIQHDQSVHVHLSPSFVDLAEVNVVANRQEAGVDRRSTSTYKITPNDLQWVPSTTDEQLIRTLQLLPGVSGGSDGRAQLMIRGGTPYQHLVRFNGINLYHTHHFFGFTSALHENVIQDVDLFKGGYPAMFGGRTSGILDIHSTPGDFDNFQGEVNLTSLHAGVQANVPLFGQGALQVAMRRSFADMIKTSLYRRFMGASLGQFINEDEVFDEDAPPTGLAYNDLFVHANQHLKTGTKIGLTLYRSVDDINYFYFDEEFTDDFSPEDEEQLVRFEETNGTVAKTFGYSGQVVQSWSENHESQMEWASTRFENTFSYGTTLTSAGINETRAEEFANRLDDVEFRLGHKVFYGNESMFSGGYWYQRLQIGFSHAESSGEADSYVDKAFTQGGYLQNDWKVLPRLKLNTGLRLSYYNITEDYYLAPRAALEFQLFKYLYLKGAWGIHYQYIDRLDQLDILRENSRFWIFAEDGSPPTRADHRIAGFRYENIDYSLDVELYRYNLSSVLEFLPNLAGNPGITDDEILDDGKGRQEGLDVHLMKKNGPVKGWVSYSFTRSERQSDEIRSGDWYPTKQDHRHKTAIALVYARGPWQLSANWQYGSGTPYTIVFEGVEPVEENEEEEIEFDEVLVSGPANAERLSPIHRLDISLHRTVLLKRSMLEAGVTFFNVYNYRNVWRRNYRGESPPAIAINYLTPGFTPAFNLRLLLR